MNNLIVLPVVLPIFFGIVMVIFHKRIMLQRAFGVLALMANGTVALLLIDQIDGKGIQTLAVGGWMPPFGIVLVADMLAAMLVLTTSLVALACLWFAFRSIGRSREKYYFYPLVMFLIAGVSGSFLTGDIFNLFVFFEVMLISSYALIVHGGTRIQLRESLKYLLFNVVSSVLFVTTVAFLYRLTGTLNMAHLAERVAEADQAGLLTVVALMFMVVFGVKAALFLYFWLPGAYSAPPAAVAALFSALLTKVGIYSLFRMFSLIFIHQTYITHQLLGWLGAITIILGVIGAVAYKDIHKIITYNVVAAVGFVVFALGILSHKAFEGAIYYLIHDMIVKALLFLAAGALIMLAGTAKLDNMGGLMKKAPLLGWVLFATAISLAGIPPLSGFIGKLLIIQSAFESAQPAFYWIAAIGLLSSLLLLYSIIKIFMQAFWKEPYDDLGQPSNHPHILKGLLAPCVFLLILSFAMGIGAEWLYPYVSKAAETLSDPAIYIEAVLRPE